MRLSREELVDVLRPAMNWVSTMSTEMVVTGKGVYAGVTNATGREIRYREDMIEVFGEEFVDKVVYNHKLTMLEFVAVCEVILERLNNLEDETEELTPFLDDMRFWSGEVVWSMERVRKLVVAAGFDYEVNEIINYVGNDLVGTRRLKVIDNVIDLNAAWVTYQVQMLSDGQDPRPVEFILSSFEMNEVVSEELMRSFLDMYDIKESKVGELMDYLFERNE